VEAAIKSPQYFIIPYSPGYIPVLRFVKTAKITDFIS